MVDISEEQILGAIKTIESGEEMQKYVTIEFLKSKLEK